MEIQTQHRSQQFIDIDQLNEEAVRDPEAAHRIAAHYQLKRMGIPCRSTRGPSVRVWMMPPA